MLLPLDLSELPEEVPSVKVLSFRPCATFTEVDSKITYFSGPGTDAQKP